MSDSPKFPLFRFLPPELRLMIWEFSLSPRLLSLHCESLIECYRPAYNISMVLHRRRSLGVPVSEKRERLSGLMRLTPVSIDPIPISSVCYESREVVLKSGYRTWRFYNQEGRGKDVLWNPTLDTVAMVGPHTRGFPSFYPQMLEILFPSQANDIQKLAIPTSSWQSLPEYIGERWKEDASRWLSMGNLEEIVVVVDETWERERMEWINPALPMRDRFQIPEDIETSLRKYSEATPAVRVVRHESGIMGQEDIHMSLRCSGCSLELSTV